jgi:restriction endonuclease Mrr
MSSQLLPRNIELLDSIMRVLDASASSMSSRAIDDAVAKELGLLESQLIVMRTPKRSEYKYRMAWARTKLKSQGLILKLDDGSWKIIP